MDLKQATAAGEAGMALVESNANDKDPLFSEKAQAAIIARLKASPMNRANSEDLVDYAKEQGAVPHDDRAFGGVFQRLARRGQIKFVAFVPRRKGHGAPGCRVYELGQP